MCDKSEETFPFCGDLTQHPPTKSSPNPNPHAPCGKMYKRVSAHHYGDDNGKNSLHVCRNVDLDEKNDNIIERWRHSEIIHTQMEIIFHKKNIGFSQQLLLHKIFLTGICAISK